jgi:ribosomal-protein-alanine N-acetyltransferase
MTHKGTVTLETERLILRRFALDDADAMYRNWASDHDVTKYLMWKPHSSIHESRSVIALWVDSYAKPDHYQWAITPKAIGEPIGDIAVMSIDAAIRSASVGYAIGKAWWHRGYTSEALAVVVKFLFEEVGVNRIEGYHNTANPNSGRVMEKAGLKYEGMGRQAGRDNSGVHDTARYAILADEYFGQNRLRIRRKADGAIVVQQLGVYENHHDTERRCDENL